VLVSLGLFFENYDIGLVNAALPQIAKELAIEARDTGFTLGVIRLGGLGALLMIPLADRLGRRRVFLAALVGMSVGTFATALSQSAWQFALAQMLTRSFLLSVQALGIVILVEELPAGHRASGLGLLGVLGGLGFGLAAGLYAAIDLVPFGWRALYGVGLVPLLLLPFFRRSLKETTRFEREKPKQGVHPLRAWLEPVAQLARTHPERVAVVGLAGVFGAASGIAFFQYTSLFVQTFHGWSPGHYTLLVLGGGMIGVFGNVVGGRGSDRFGRRRIGFLGYALMPLCIGLFVLGPSATLVPAWGLAVLFGTAADVVVRALATELFPTSHRAAAGGWLIGVQTVGWSLGLFGVGLLTRVETDLPLVIAGVSLAGFVGALAVLRVPETHDRELEEI
jgi:AAHS family benzoate transporter-like MFS transporter